jgi:hypothetical protein
MVRIVRLHAPTAPSCACRIRQDLPEQAGGKPAANVTVGNDAQEW